MFVSDIDILDEEKDLKKKGMKWRKTFLHQSMVDHVECRLLDFSGIVYFVRIEHVNSNRDARMLQDL